jgi:addiction module RelE/StbE family toxin
MPGKYRLKFTPQAERDLDDIFNYITCELKNLPAAIKLIDEIRDALVGLEGMPKSCPLSDINELRKDGYRKCVVKNYVALYTVNESLKNVTVVKVFYGMRDYRNLGLF